MTIILFKTDKHLPSDVYPLQKNPFPLSALFLFLSLSFTFAKLERISVVVYRQVVEVSKVSNYSHNF